jgi:hypothetical protein
VYLEDKKGIGQEGKIVRDDVLRDVGFCDFRRSLIFKGLYPVEIVQPFDMLFCRKKADTK